MLNQDRDNEGESYISNLVKMQQNSDTRMAIKSYLDQNHNHNLKRPNLKQSLIKNELDDNEMDLSSSGRVNK